MAYGDKTPPAEYLARKGEEPCIKCGSVDFYYNQKRRQCRACAKAYRTANRVARNAKHAAYMRKIKASDPAKIAWYRRGWKPSDQRRYRLRKQYGLTEQEFQRLREAQDNACAICREAFGKAPCVDHDHVSGAVRGLLCSNCNVGIGLFAENPERLIAAIRYLSPTPLELVG